MRHKVGTRAGAAIVKGAFAVVAAVTALPVLAQDREVPFAVQQVGDQVVNGVLIQGARVPVWTDPSGRPGGRVNAAQGGATNEAELNDLARIGSGQANRPAAGQRLAAANLSVRPQRNGPEFEVVGGAPASAASAAAVVRKRTKSEAEELEELERAVELAQSEYRRKQRQIEARKKDDERRAEEARIALEKEAARQRLVFQAKGGQLLSEAISAYVGQNGWENVEWNVGPDFQIKYMYAERPRAGETMADVLLRVLEPYGLSAQLHRPNSVVEIFPSNEAQSRK